MTIFNLHLPLSEDTAFAKALDFQRQGTREIVRLCFVNNSMPAKIVSGFGIFCLNAIFRAAMAPMTMLAAVLTGLGRFASLAAFGWNPRAFDDLVIAFVGIPLELFNLATSLLFLFELLSERSLEQAISDKDPEEFEHVISRLNTTENRQGRAERTTAGNELVLPIREYGETPPYNSQYECYEENIFDHSLLLRVVQSNNEDLAQIAIREVEQLQIDSWEHTLDVVPMPNTIEQAKMEAAQSTNETIRTLFKNLEPRHIRKLEIFKSTLYNDCRMPMDLVKICIEYTDSCNPEWDCRRIAVIPMTRISSYNGNDYNDAVEMIIMMPSQN